MIGLGSSYNYDNYGAQFCIPRNNTSSPPLSVRYREGGAWTSWSSIEAGKLSGSANFNTNVWQTSYDGKQRIYFEGLSRTIIQGYATTPSNNAFEFWNSSSTLILGINDNGNAYFRL